ncbi:MAG: sensor histidine kinase [Planctomycetota bacterium]|jgi:two-component system phosphate regulon sensor histidine kinase PhoR
MRPSPLFLRFLAGSCLVVLPALWFLQGAVTELAERNEVELEGERLALGTRVLVRPVTAWLTQPAGQREPADMLLREDGMRLTVFDSEGLVLGDTDPADDPRVTAELARSDIALARAVGFASSERMDHVAERIVRMRTVRLSSGDSAVLGFLRLGVLRSERPSLASELEERFALAVLCGALLAAGAAWMWARGVDRPVQALASSVDQLASGEFDSPIRVPERGPFRELGLAIEDLKDASRARVDTMTTDRNKVLAILGVMVEGIVAVDAEERIVHMNAAAARILGVQSANTDGRRVLEVTRVREIHQILARVLGDGQEEKMELRVVQPPRDRYVGIHATPLVDADSEIVGAVMMLNDVTELRRLEAIRRDFVANVSHELKTPITAIRGIVETVLDDPAMEPGVRDRFIARIRDQAMRLSSLVTDLLTLSRLESDSPIGEMQFVDLRIAVSDCHAAHVQHAEDKGVRMGQQLPSAPVRVLAEMDSMRLLIGNLIDNAIKYTPAGGHVRIALTTEDQHALLVVEDDGIGIERKHLERIFQRFYRVDKARSRELGGTGLGLSIVKHVCIAHRGDVSVDSAPGEGTRFTVKLPLA